MINILHTNISKILLFLFVISSLTSCSIYRSTFSCGDASGATCMTMDAVDRMITNGEIERFNETRLKKKTIYKADKEDENISPQIISQEPKS